MSPARKRRTRKPAKPRVRALKPGTPATLPSLVYAEASPRSLGGVSLFDAQEQIRAETVGSFFSDEEIVERAAARLTDAGFQVLQVTPLTINIAAPAETYRQAFNTDLYAEERPVIKEFGQETTAAIIDTRDTPLSGLISTAGTPFADLIEGVALEEPRYFMAPLMYPPLKAYWHLRVPADVSLATNADRAHRGGITGRGVRIAMVDSGWYKHPHFVGRGYRAAPVILGPGAANPLADESGHGTGESANIFAVAPDIELSPVKMSFVNTIGAFNAAVGLGPDIITCSWGSSKLNPPLSAADQALAAAIAAAVANGITVVFAAGNGHFGFPGQHPDVISAGGVFMDADESLRASDYASGFASNIYPGRNVPDLCGLVGMKPRAAYIMLPVEPGDDIDTDLAGGIHPNADETAANDGWAAFSGTSAAAPHLAGAAALIKEACPRLGPTEIREILISSARDVTAGNCNTSTGGHAAAAGPDLATGAGLVDAHKAVMLAKVRCLGPIPIQPVPPPIIPPIRVTPVQPPITVRPPIQPPITIRPPITPPIQPPIVVRPPIRPPITPITPVQPGGPGAGPSRPGLEGPVAPPRGVGEGAARQLSAEDVKALEEMVRSSELELG